MGRCLPCAGGGVSGSRYGYDKTGVSIQQATKGRPLNVEQNILGDERLPNDKAATESDGGCSLGGGLSGVRVEENGLNSLCPYDGESGGRSIQGNRGQEGLGGVAQHEHVFCPTSLP